MGEQDARELLVDFMTDAHVRLETMRTHLEDDRLVRLSEEAHALKSSAAMMGLARLSAVSLALEHAAARADRDAAQNLNQAARTAFDDARPFVDEVLLAA
jgi:HPt (histidine-containing phosphotransfer) domain-containing protein